MECVNELCTICLGNLQDHDSYTLTCNHRFHTSCIIQSLRYDQRCPLCRDDGKQKHTIDELSDEDWESIMRHMWNRLARQRNALARKNEHVGNLRSKFWESRKAFQQLRRKVVRKERQLEQKYVKKINREMLDMYNELELLGRDMERHQCKYEMETDKMIHK